MKITDEEIKEESREYPKTAQQVAFQECIKWHREQSESSVPDLSTATPDQKTLIIKELTETTAKAVLTVFIALGLKT